MQNSLFAHYLFETLGGQARIYGEGLIRILDMRNFMAKAVPKRQRPGHQRLKTEVETNFPVALPWRGTRHPGSRIARSTIENPRNLPLPPEAKCVLQTMFADYQRVVIEKEFGGGSSGSQVFLICPIRSNGVPELPAVVKMGSVSLIQREWQAYRDYIRDRLPNSVGVRGAPIFAPNGGWAGLRYPLVGSGTFEIESLHSYCRRASLEDMRFVLEGRLLKIMEQVMQYNRFSSAFYLRASYDHVLPVNLLIKPDSAPPGTQVHLIRPDALPNRLLKRGDYVRLAGFTITKVDLLKQTITLNVPPRSKGAAASYCLRVRSVESMAGYQVDQVIDPIEGMVLETRHERLEMEAGRALGPDFDLTNQILTAPDGTKLPNPLLAWGAIIDEYRPVRVGCIHGDLNMENILVDPATRDVSLIDVAAAREDHLLHDFLRLETETVTKLIPQILIQANLDAGIIRPFYERLTHTGEPEVPKPPHRAMEKPWAMLVAMRETANKYLSDPEDWSEYYQGLVLYLLGALKFRNLDETPLSKQVAFWGAATAAGLLEKQAIGE
jgi:hypothetical protein